MRRGARLTRGPGSRASACKCLWPRAQDHNCTSLYRNPDVPSDRVMEGSTHPRTGAQRGPRKQKLFLFALTPNEDFLRGFLAQHWARDMPAGRL